MATWDGGFSGRPVTLRLHVNQDGQNVGGNYSTLGFALEAIKTGNTTAWNNNPSYYVIRINGAEWSGSWTYNFNGGIGQAIQIRGWAQTDVGHNSDGTKDVNVYADASDPSGYLGFASCGGWMTLTTIPRATNPTWTGNFEAGTAKTISLPRASGSFTHVVDYYFGSASGQIGTGLGTSVSWTPPMSLLNQMPNNASASGFFRVQTWNGGTLIGIVDDTFTLTAPASVVPDFTTVTNSEATAGLAANVGKYVQHISKLSLAITGAAGVYGSSISNYKIEVAGQTINAQSGTTAAAITTSGAAVPIVGTVTDSRGRVKQKTVNVEVLPYAPPTITSISVDRSLSNGTQSDEGTYLRVNVNASAQSLMNTTERNSMSIKTYTRLRGTTTWTLNETHPIAAVTFNSYRVVGTFSIEEAYDVLVEVSDEFSTSATQFSIPTATIFQHWDGSDGMGVGKYRTHGMLDVLGQIYQNDGKRVLDTNSLFGSTTARDAFWGTPSTLADRIALQNKAASWTLVATDLVADQVYLAEYDATLNPKGSPSGAGWYIVRQHTAGLANKRTKLLFSNDDATYPTTFPSGTTTTGTGVISVSKTISLTYPQLVRVKVHMDWYSGGNAAGSDYIRMTNSSGEVLEELRTNNAGTTSLVVPVVMETEVYLPSGSSTLVVTSNHESASSSRTLNNRKLQVWAV